MAMGRRKDERQGQMFIAIAELPATAGHPFDERLNAALRAIKFDRRAEAACATFYHEKVGRPGIPPGVYFRMLLIGYSCDTRSAARSDDRNARFSRNAARCE